MHALDGDARNDLGRQRQTATFRHSLRRVDYVACFLGMLANASLTSCSTDSSAPVGPWSAVLITLDTTRADALGAYGGSSDRTPSLDRLASEGVVFDAAFTVAPLTLPAHSSILTGLYPPRHTVRDNGLWPLPASAYSVAEAAQGSGIQTAAFVAAVVLDKSFGLAQGFDTYDGPRKPDKRLVNLFTERKAEDVVERALRWIREREQARPFFLWVHLFDPHAPYMPPKSFQRGTLPKRLYEGEVSYADVAIGRLLDGLRVDGALESTFIAFAADHGEAFGEHGEERHGTNGYQATIKVPLIVRYPDGRRAGERSSAIVSVVDLAPTLAEALGLTLPVDIDGFSLHGAGPPTSRGAYFETYTGYTSFGYSPLAGWVDRDGKYVHSSAPQFFDLEADPDENENLFGLGRIDVEPYRAAIDRLISTRPLDGDRESVDDQLRADVRSLGYASMATNDALPHPLAPSDRRSPADSVEAHKRTLRAMDLLAGGHPDRARPLFQALANENPMHFIALEALGACNLQTQRPLEAIEPLQRLLQHRPELTDSHFNLGLAFWHAGRNEEAERSFLRAIELAPERPSLYPPLIGLLEGEGRSQDAMEHQTRLLELTAPR